MMTVFWVAGDPFYDNSSESRNMYLKFKRFFKTGFKDFE